jgi:hypothetical protein
MFQYQQLNRTLLRFLLHHYTSGPADKLERSGRGYDLNYFHDPSSRASTALRAPLQWFNLDEICTNVNLKSNKNKTKFVHVWMKGIVRVWEQEYWNGEG